MKAKTASPETAVLTAERKLHNTWVYIKRHWQLYLLFLLPAVVLTLVFKYAPMGGVLIAFQKYNPFKGIWGSEWVGFKNFTRFMSSPDFQRYLINTLKLSVYGLLWGFPIPSCWHSCSTVSRARRSSRRCSWCCICPTSSRSSCCAVSSGCC